MSSRQIFRFPRTAIALAVSCASCSVIAQDLAIEEITVTANKRSESVQDVPLAITAVSGDFIKKVNVNDTKDLIRFSPGLAGNTQDSFLDRITVRGISSNDFGNGGDPSVGVFTNGNYQGRNGSAVAELFDIERVEVLRGPQGFLFGRNAISGAINAHTVKPDLDEASGFVSVDAGQRNNVRVEAAYNQPINDSMAVRIAVLHSEEQGWVKNVFDGRKQLGGNNDALRLSFLYENEHVRVDSYAEYGDVESTGTVYRARATGAEYNRLLDYARRVGRDSPLPLAQASRFARNSDMDANGRKPVDESDSYRLGNNIVVDFEEFSITSTTGYIDHNYRYLEDEDGTPLEIFLYEQDQNGSYFEQEFRITSNSDDAFSWYAGASYYREKIATRFLGEQSENSYCYAEYDQQLCAELFENEDEEFLLDEFGVTEYTPSSSGRITDANRTEGVFSGASVYVDLGYRFNEQWSVNGGVRYTKDDKKFSQQSFLNDSIFVSNLQAPDTGGEIRRSNNSWENLTWRVIAEYTPTDEHLVFASAATGSKSGGFDSFNLVDETGLPASFNEERVTSYELGHKSTLLDGSMQLNNNVFYYDYSDLQTTFTIGTSFVTHVGNVGKVKGYGVESSLQWNLSDSWSLLMGGSFLKTELTGVQFICEDPAGNQACEGQEQALSPRYTFFGSLEYSYPVDSGEWLANISYSWEGKMKTGINPNVASSVYGPRESDLSVAFVDNDGWTARFYVDNLSNSFYFDTRDGNRVNPDFTGQITPLTDINPSRPRTVGFGIEYEF